MTPQEIQPGTRLELDLLSKSGEKIGNTYVSQMLEILENSSLVISAPIFEARLVYVPIQALLRITFLHPKYGLLGFEATVTEREIRGNMAIMVVHAEGELERIQRRSHFRLDHMAKALVWVCGKDNREDKKAAGKASTKNISGSGLCIVTDFDIPIGTEVDIEFNLTDSILIKARCTAIRNSCFQIKSMKNYEIGLHFTKLSQRDQDNIIRYIFEQQRVQLKK